MEWNNRVSSALSLCSPMIMSRLEGALSRQIESGQQRLMELSFPAADRVYIGSEACEYLFCRNADVLLNSAKTLNESGLAVTLVTPPVSQFEMDSVLTLISRFDLNLLADEVVCNDIGVIRCCISSLKHMKIRAGRFFDKVSREARFDPFKASEMQKNRRIFRTPWPVQNELGAYLKRMGIDGFETDCIPGETLDMDFPGWSFALWYPGIILSYATTCEFAGSQLPVDQKFIPGRCLCECTDYSVEACARDTYMKIIKSGRIVEAVCHTDICDCFKGNCRVVLSTQPGRKSE